MSKLEDDRTPLHWAASQGNEEKVKELLSLPETEVDVTDDLGWTPLMIATSAGKFPIVKMLVEAGANVNLTNNNGQSCLHYAASKNLEDIAAFLIKSGCAINVRDKGGCAPIHRAASRGQMRVLKVLFELGNPQVNCKDNLDMTPLHMAAEEEREEACKFLLDHGASIDVENKDKIRPLEMCRTLAFRQMLHNYLNPMGLNRDKPADRFG